MAQEESKAPRNTPAPAPEPSRVRRVVETTVEGNAPASRTVVVRFDEFVERLVELGEPDVQFARELLAGADLVRALMDETDEFGRAAPDAEGAEVGDYTAKVLALTDEAFSSAHELLEPYDWTFARTPRLDARTALVDAVASVLDADLYRCVGESLLSCPQASDPALGKEFA